MSAHRLRSKRMNALRRARRWQLRLVLGHHHRWTLAARGHAGYGTWDNPERHYPPEYDPPRLTNKLRERRRLALLWGIKKP